MTRSGRSFAGIRLTVMGGILAVGVAWPAAAAAQDAGPDLDRIEVLAADGRTGDARESLLTWWDTEWNGASRDLRERALWLRGLLTLEPTEASASYRRIVTEYPGGAFAGRALHRLGSLAAAVGDTAAAGQWYALLARDYAGSTLGESAEAWLAGDRSAMVGVEPVPRAAAPERPPTPVPVSEAPPATPPAASEASAPAEGDESEADLAWTVQLGAFASESTAREIAAEARAAGFEVRVVLVEDSDLWRVRSGRFRDADAARPLHARMVEAGLVAAVVPGADQEVGGA